MKKLLLTISTFFIIVILKANPIPSPSVAISELFFKDNSKWVIELQYFDLNSHLSIDTIWIKSSTGISQIKRFDFVGSTGVIVIENDSLHDDLFINQTGDSIAVIYVMSGYKLISKPIIFGNFQNSTLSRPTKGQSIAGVPTYSNGKIYYYYKYDGLYSIDKSPTIGALNDSLGMCGLLRGKIYDKYNKLLTGLPSSTFELEIKKQETYLPIFLNTDGSYYLNMVSLNTDVSVLLYRYGNNQGDFVNISPIKISMQPDSLVNMDIHIQDSLRVGINEIKNGLESIIKLFPNPSSKLSLDYEIAIPVKSSNCFIQLLDLNGQKIAQFQVKDNFGKINLPSNIKNGFYSILLFVNNKNYSSSKILIYR